MKRINDLIAWLYILGTIILGFILLLGASGWLGNKDYLEAVISGQLSSQTGILAGIIMIVAGLIFLKMRISARTGDKCISFDNPEGEVTISIKAIEDFVKRVGQEFSQIVDMSSQIVPVHGGLKVKVKVSLLAGSNVPQITENIQHVIKSRVQNILGIESILGIEVNVSKIIPGTGSEEETISTRLTAE